MPGACSQLYDASTPPARLPPPAWPAEAADAIEAATSKVASELQQGGGGGGDGPRVSLQDGLPALGTAPPAVAEAAWGAAPGRRQPGGAGLLKP